MFLYQRQTLLVGYNVIVGPNPNVPPTAPNPIVPATLAVFAKPPITFLAVNFFLATVAIPFLIDFFLPSFFDFF